MIKKIGTAAREELERFFDTKVFLDLHVRVKAEWREDDRMLGLESRTIRTCPAESESFGIPTGLECRPSGMPHRSADSADLQAR